VWLIPLVLLGGLGVFLLSMRESTSIFDEVGSQLTIDTQGPRTAKQPAPQPPVTENPKATPDVVAAVIEPSEPQSSGFTDLVGTEASDVESEPVEPSDAASAITGRCSRVIDGDTIGIESDV